MPLSNNLPVPTEDQKKTYSSPSIPSLPVPTKEQAASYTSIPDLPIPTQEDKKLYEPLSEVPDLLFQKDLETVAGMYGVSAEDLRAIAPYYGVKVAPESTMEALEMGGKGVLGFIGRANPIAPSLPQFLYKKSQTPEMRQAIDRLSEIASKQRTYADAAIEFAIPGSAIGAASKKVLPRLAGGAAAGALAGLGVSKEGEELETAATGAALGGGLAGALETARLGVALRAARKASKPEQELISRVVETQGPELDRGTEEILKARTKSNGDIESVVFNPSASLDENATQRIIEEQIDPETLAKVLNPASEEGAILRKGIGDIEGSYSEAIQKKLAEDIVDRRARDFAEEISKSRPATREEAQEVIQEYANRQGIEATKQKYQLMVEEEAAQDYITKTASRAGLENSFQNRALNTLSDAQFVLRDIDERLGTETETVHKELNSAYTRMSYPRQEARKQVSEIYNNLDKATDAEIVHGDKIYNALDKGETAGLNAGELRAADEFKQYFDRQREYVNQLVRTEDPAIAPLSIPKLDNYVPHMMAGSSDLANRVNIRLNELQTTASREAGRPITDIAQLTPKEWGRISKSPAAQDLIAGLKVFDNRPISTAADLSARLKDTFQSRNGRIRLDTKARAALERQGEIPLWMRETNLYKLADRWATNTLKHLYLRKSMDKLSSYTRRLEKIGADVEAEYIRKLLMDINGIRSGTAAESSMKARVAWQTKLDEIADKAKTPAAKAVLIAAKAVPDILSDLNRQIYPNLLGLSPRAILMNATQVWAKTAPELGTKYGYTTVMRGATHALLNLPQQAAKVKQMGFQPADFISKYSKATADGIRRSSLYAIPSELLQKMGDVSMYLYTKMDTLNRAITLSTAEMMASDLARGSQLAQESLKKMPASVRKALSRTGGNEEAMARILADHLNASTQYNYNRPSMSEWGRTMGPFFSTFSKWPTATAGEIVQEFRNRGITGGSLRNAEKYIAPFALFQLIDYALFQNDPDNMSDRQKKLLGYGGLTQSAPIGAITGVVTGDFFTPPAIDAIVQSTIVPIVKGDSASMQKGMIDALQKFTPGSVYVRFLTDDLVTYLKGQRPEGSDFIERTQAGLRELEK